MRTLILFLAFFTSLSGMAQVMISGTVTDKKGESIPGVNIYIKDTFDGASTDADGAFAFETTATDSLVLMATAIGFSPYEQLLTSTTGLVLVLKQQVNQLNAVSITAGSIDVSDKASSVVMKPLDILTTAGAIGDITGALNTLPGTATVANDGRLFVRGGDASETAIFFDGLRVGNAYGSTTAGVPTRNRFSPALFKGTFFSTGGYSAEYGGALSSVLSLQTVDEPVRNQTDISLMSVGASVSSTFVGEKQSVTGEIGLIDLSPYQEVVKQLFDWEDAPSAYSGQVVYRHKMGKNGMVKAFVQGSTSSMTIWQQQPGDDSRGQRIGVDNDFGFANVSYKKLLSTKWLSEGGASLSLNDDQFAIDTLRFGNNQSLAHIKQKFTHYFSEGLKLMVGAEVFYQKYGQSDETVGLEIDFNEWSSAAFAEAEWYASPFLTVRGGLRAGHTGLNEEFVLEPRLAAAVQVYPKGSISVATGYFSQAVDDQYRIWNNALNQTHAAHYQVSFQHSDENRTFRAEVYAKRYTDLFLQDSQLGSNNGEGYARGFDLFYRDKKTFKNTDFWVTYSFVNSRRMYDQFQTEIQPSFAPTHNLSVVAKYWIADLKSQIGGAWSLNSGYTYDNPNTIGVMESVSPNYASLSVNWSYLVRQNLIIHAAVNNVTGRDNIFGYSYSNEPNAQGQHAQMARRQPAKRFVFIGVFWTISSDKQANQLNNL